MTVAEKPKMSGKFVVVLVLLGIDALLTIAGVQVGAPVHISAGARAFGALVDIGAIAVLAIGFTWGWWTVVGLLVLALIMVAVPYINLASTFGRLSPEMVGSLIGQTILPGITLRLLFRIREEVAALDAWRRAKSATVQAVAAPATTPIPVGTSAPARLQELRTLKDQGLISDADFETKKAAIIQEL